MSVVHQQFAWTWTLFVPSKLWSNLHIGMWSNGHIAISCRKRHFAHEPRDTIRCLPRFWSLFSVHWSPIFLLSTDVNSHTFVGWIRVALLLLATSSVQPILPVESPVHPFSYLKKKTPASPLARWCLNYIWVSFMVYLRVNIHIWLYGKNHHLYPLVI